jgi:hypothetical protein
MGSWWVCGVSAQDIDLLLSAEAEARAGLNAALKECSAYARKAGEAQGRLDASELAGVVEGWRERAESAEASLAQAREQLAEASVEVRAYRLALKDTASAMLKKAGPTLGDVASAEAAMKRAAKLHAKLTGEKT